MTRPNLSRYFTRPCAPPKPAADPQPSERLSPALEAVAGLLAAEADTLDEGGGACPCGHRYATHRSVYRELRARVLVTLCPDCGGMP